jgi:hypothetical protein
MIASPTTPRTARTARAAVAKLVLAGLPLVACGGRSQDPHGAARDPAGAATGGTSMADNGGTGAGASENGGTGASSAENGGTSTSAGASTGGSPVGAGAGGQSAAGAAGAAAQTRTFCWVWSDLKNEPKPGETGPAACPSFYDLDFVVRHTCGYTVPNPAPIPPDSTAKGDCCYGVTDFNCR